MSFAKVLSEMMSSSQNQQGEAHRMRGGLVGIVIDNVDPEHRYRVRVSFPWLAGRYNQTEDSDGNEGKIQSFWARMTSFMTGGDRGSYFMPEIDDEVLVVFEDGDFMRPIIVGSLWNGKDKCPSSNLRQNKENNLRFIKSRCHHKLMFDDTKDKENVFLRSHKNAELYIDDTNGEEKVRIYDQNHTQWLEIDVNKKKITMQTDTGDILIKAKNNIDVQCKNLNVAVEQTISVSAKKVNASASGSMAAKCQGPVSVESSANMKLKASIIDLNP